MKFLILAGCVCLAAALPQRPTDVAYGAAKVAASPFVATYHAADHAASTVAGHDRKTRAAGDVEAQVLRSESDVKADGFSYSFETSNKIAAEATGTLKQIGQESGLEIKGQYQYTGEDGVPVQVNYVADENGFQPQSDLLPVPPPVPEAIKASLKYIEEHPYQEKH